MGASPEALTGMFFGRQTFILAVVMYTLSLRERGSRGVSRIASRERHDSENSKPWRTEAVPQACRRRQTI